MRMTALSLAILLLTACGTAVAEQESPPSEKEPAPEKAAPGPQELEKAGLALVEALRREDYAEAVRTFDETMKQALPLEKLQATWESIKAQAGAVEEVLGTRTEKVQVYDVIYVTTRFERRILDVKVVLNSRRQISGLFFTPAKPAEQSGVPGYADPTSFREVKVVVGTGTWSLPGILTLPAVDGPRPGLVLVHGSGPHDRDETIGPNKPFRDLAWGLATRGIAVLRYDKRTFAHRERMAGAGTEITVNQETVEDALLAIHRLRAEPGVDPGRLFVAGHSLGAMMIPRIAAGDDRVAGFVVMAGPGRPLEEVILAQSRYLAGLDGELSGEERARLDELRAGIEQMRRDGKPFMGAPASYWKDLQGYRPHLAAQEIHRPMLVLLGGRDYQVTQEDFHLWKEALGTRPDVRFVLFPELNHLFMAGEGPPGPSDYQAPGHVSLQVIEKVATWILDERQRLSFVAPAS